MIHWVVGRLLGGSCGALQEKDPGAGLRRGRVWRLIA